jgi:hypothetical protein
MIRTQYQAIQSLVTDIKDGKLLLPEMQRSYVWKSTQVRDLFDSLYHDYPSGQLLVWETDDLPASGNRRASIEGIISEDRHPQLLLDGQQRLTSLTAIMLGRPLRVRDVSKPIDIAFNVHTEKFEVTGPRQRGQTGWISLVKFFTEGIMSVFIDLKLDNSAPETRDVLEHLNKLENIKKYKYNVNVLERLSYTEVTHIFVRTNSGGTKLGYADLALAQVSSSWQGVTEELEQYQKDLAKQGLEVDTGLLLSAIVVILTGQSHFTRFFKGDKQDVTVEELKAAWKRAKKAFDQALGFLVNNCLINHLELLPTRSIFMPLVAYFDRYGSSLTDKQLRELQCWVYMALIWTRYSASSESTMDQDIAALASEQPIRAMIQNIESVIGPHRAVTEHELQDQRKNSPYMLLSYVLARRNGAQDWFNGTVISKCAANELYHSHHIFPKSLLNEKYDLRRDSRVVDQVANLAFLAAPASKKLTNQPPAKYLPTVEEQRLQAQYMPLERDLWELDKFEECMRQRRMLLADAINQLLQSLAGEKYLVVHGPAKMMEARVSAVEQQMRQLVEKRLSEAWGASAWKRLVPEDIRSEAQKRIAQQEANKPYEAGLYQTLDAKLMFCQFSDYFKIIQVKTNWPLFEDVFGSDKTFAKYSSMAIDARNALKHGRDLSHVDLSAAEASLSWLEECLAKVKQEDVVDEDSELAEEIA